MRRYFGLIAAAMRLAMASVVASWKLPTLRKLVRYSFSDLDSTIALPGT